MAHPVNMPQVGQDIKTGIIVKWYFKEGDHVKKGDIIATVESDKADFDVEVFNSGTIIKILYKEGNVAEVLQPIAYIGNPGEEIGSLTEKRSESSSISVQKSDTGPEESGSLSGKALGIKKKMVSPSARRLANENKIDINGITGSGPGGRIIRQDILDILEKKESVYVPGPETGITEREDDGDRRIPFSKIRRKMAERLSLSKQTIPHYYLFLDIDVTELIKWRDNKNKNSEVRLTINDLIIHAAAGALREYPMLNAHVINDEVVLKSRVNIGIAVSLEEGLLVPVIPDTDRKSPYEISLFSRELIEDARDGKLKPVGAGTFTVSNLGMYGISRFQAIINPPECAILSIGAVEDKILPGKGGFKYGKMITLGLACDHRVVDGAYASRFLEQIKNNLVKITE
jgi:pyruvate dehydrogenase E2 component (dihydrolipoamide acetyltransferase)